MEKRKSHSEEEVVGGVKVLVKKNTHLKHKHTNEWLDIFSDIIKIATETVGGGKDNNVVS